MTSLLPSFSFWEVLIYTSKDVANTVIFTFLPFSLMIFLYLLTSKLYQNIYHSCCIMQVNCPCPFHDLDRRWNSWHCSRWLSKPVEKLTVRIRADQYDSILGVRYTQPEQEKVDEACKKPHRPWSLWGMSTIPISAGRTTQQGTSNAVGFWSAWVVISWHRWLRSQRGKARCWTWHLNKEEPVGCIKVGGSHGCINTETVEFRVLRHRSNAKAELQP